MEYLVVIPARYVSSRLPGKPLVDLCGTPMIVRTYRRCALAAPAERICVATEDDRIRHVCESAGIRTVMTSADCLTGTDRVAQVAENIAADTYINVQGDEPLFNPADLRKLIEAARMRPQTVMNGYCAIADQEAFRSPMIPKVVFRPDGRLLYMSRGAIPTTKKLAFHQAWRQVCAYAFPPKALKDFSSCATKTTLEEMEDIEILRFLELGWEIQMLEMSDHSIAVDTPEDAERVRHVILNGPPAV